MPDIRSSWLAAAVMVVLVVLAVALLGAAVVPVDIISLRHQLDLLDQQLPLPLLPAIQQQQIRILAQHFGKEQPQLTLMKPNVAMPVFTDLLLILPVEPELLMALRRQ